MIKACVMDVDGTLTDENISLEETAYIGDDLNDLVCMNAMGLKGCPRDAAREI